MRSGGGGVIQSFLRFIRMSGFEKEKSAGIFLTSNSRSKIPFGQLERISGLVQLGTRFSLPSLAAWTQFLLDHLQSNLHRSTDRWLGNTRGKLAAQATNKNCKKQND